MVTGVFCKDSDLCRAVTTISSIVPASAAKVGAVGSAKVASAKIAEAITDVTRCNILMLYSEIKYSMNFTDYWSFDYKLTAFLSSIVSVFKANGLSLSFCA